MNVVSSFRNRFRTRSVWNAAKIALALLLIGFVVHQVRVDDLVDMIVHTSLTWLLLGCLFYCGTTWFLAVRYWLLIERQVSLFRLLAVVVVQNAITNFAAGGLGAVSYVAVLRGEHELPMRRGVVSLLFAKVGDLVALFLALAASSYFLWTQIDPLHLVVLALLLFLALGLVVLLLAILCRDRLGNLACSLGARLEYKTSPLLAKIQSFLSELASLGTDTLCSCMSSLLWSSCLVTVCSAFWIYCIVQAFAIPLGWGQVVFVVSLTLLMSIVPVQVLGGLGVYEVTSIYLYGLFGVASSEAAALVVGIRILLSVLTLVSLLYLPAMSCFERKVLARPSTKLLRKR